MAIIRDSMIKYLRREDLSSQDKNIKIVTHPGCTIIDIKAIIRRKNRCSLIHSSANGLTKNVNTMKKERDKSVKKWKKC